MPTRKRSKKLLLFLIVGCFLLAVVGSIFLNNTVWAKNEITLANISIPPNVGLEPYVREYFLANNAAEMLPIIECESNFNHFEPDGTILKNRAGSSAIGITQIMSSLHPDPKILARYNRANNTDLTTEDFDIRTLKGNLGYALVLYKVNGTRDWECATFI